MDGGRFSCDGGNRGGEDQVDVKRQDRAGNLRTVDILSASIISIYIFKEIERAVAVLYDTVEAAV